ncbi:MULTISPECIES: hypothetical protein [Streptomyces]|uniref:Uncharacterized protein n=1 Tax=Streptomyces bacillaris TaxID=68179 RepID=A0ABW6E058_9ACTN|nr:hypothetical protein [Streptomyces nanshensis]
MITPARIPRRRQRAAALLAAAAVLLAACTSPDTETGTPAADPGTGHLHGLGVDPADGAVYAAGHLGVFRLSGGKAVRVADRYQDTMGFTVTGPPRSWPAATPPRPTPTPAHLTWA